MKLKIDADEAMHLLTTAGAVAFFWHLWGGWGALGGYCLLWGAARLIRRN